eukprot:TRINITY_DN6115_c0_g2_i1.p1 TRINITY_DN6115_c0_g2~~TRINITY_DN6115_c0_g2_i1.p1  ORF type:complete len:151 (-),score=1.69 TRINITY_DN6115_c0_g2_i1:370-822(-)
MSVNKKVTHWESARGITSESCLSVAISPHDCSISLAAQRFAEEFERLSKIMYRRGRLSHLSAITNAQQRLKLYHDLPPNGLLIYCGTIITDDGRERKIAVDFEPSKPPRTSMFLFDSKFNFEVFRETQDVDSKIGYYEAFSRSAITRDRS